MEREHRCYGITWVVSGDGHGQLPGGVKAPSPCYVQLTDHTMGARFPLTTDVRKLSKVCHQI